MHNVTLILVDMTIHFGVYHLSEAYQEGFVIVAKCKQSAKVLTYSFAGAKYKLAYGVHWKVYRGLLWENVLNVH